MNLKQSPRKFFLTSNDPLFASNFSMQPTTKVADNSVVLQEHDYATIRSKNLLPVHVICNQVNIGKTLLEKNVFYSIKPDFMFYDSDDEVHSSHFL
ncbi:protein U13 [macacine betaherpesvirus 9]|uniref:Protein U13 n=1 Tax=macacine betaherpesvirus 9 TaxID=2560568 RepID=A0A191S3W3_9BETA|nr:protein U13 [macacine betaherpesvirus 9]ANC96589.1 protein U13 [macacine betaherpesvirus 9]